MRNSLQTDQMMAHNELKSLDKDFAHISGVNNAVKVGDRETMGKGVLYRVNKRKEDGLETVDREEKRRKSEGSKGGFGQQVRRMRKQTQKTSHK